jgi:hypothetical protein
VRQQRNAPAVKRRTQSGFCDQPIDTEFHGGYTRRHCRA